MKDDDLGIESNDLYDDSGIDDGGSDYVREMRPQSMDSDMFEQRNDPSVLL